MENLTWKSALKEVSIIYFNQNKMDGRSIKEKGLSTVNRKKTKNLNGVNNMTFVPTCCSPEKRISNRGERTGEMKAPEPFCGRRGKRCGLGWKGGKTPTKRLFNMCNKKTVEKNSTKLGLLLPRLQIEKRRSPYRSDSGKREE